MRNFLAILERELKSYFSSPIAYVMLGLFTIVTGVFFYTIILSFEQYSMRSMMMAQQYRQMPPPVNINMDAIRPWFLNISILGLIIVLPALTMRLFAEEKHSGTIELLATSPITNWQITLGKFVSAVAFFGVMLLVSGLPIALLFLFGKPEIGPIISGYLGLLLLGASLMSTGLFCSALTENQLIALISAFVINLVLLALGWLASLVGSTLGDFFTAIAPLEHFEDFTKGIIDTKHVVFYLCFMSAGVFLTFVAVESSRWRGMR